jgi:hypothetical protein
MERNTLIYIGLVVVILLAIVAWLVLGGGSAPDAATAETPVITTVPPHKLGCG